MRTRALRVAVPALTLAVFAGIAETLLVIAGFWLAGEFPSGWQLQIGVRTVIYGGLLVLLGLTWRESRIARWAVLILLGVVGVGSLLVPMIGELVAGSGLLVALGGETSVWFAVLRGTHILLALVGSAALLVHRPAVTSAAVATG